MGPAKDKHGVRESFAKVKFLFAKNGRSGIKEFWSTTIYICDYIFISWKLDGPKREHETQHCHWRCMTHLSQRAISGCQSQYAFTTIGRSAIFIYCWYIFDLVSLLGWWIHSSFSIIPNRFGDITNVWYSKWIQMSVVQTWTSLGIRSNIRVLQKSLCELQTLSNSVYTNII